MSERLEDVIERSAASESTHQKNYRLMREHRDHAEQKLVNARGCTSAESSVAWAAEAQVHATLALFYQREVRQ